ncbi:HisA/HisF-related TIM barrel protein [Hyphomicrobium sp. D-2]|uniref:HisA/HisF-related TIM barrel protein n=1 Tax=Hyphomicrobium sp. D-2 TaxID=3041621 RepID=UPI002455EE08|nr:HisA/HisF-related TIM barrel protein [Hyphomicrobium sp. D-2]MDH4981097.1 HisA/HisF-related TIM barrel protein [Hyphomicrobium sp. D-2]
MESPRLQTSSRPGRVARVERGGKQMDIIPVLDVRHGTAVAAVKGDRANYRPLETPLATGSDPVAVARGFAQLYPFPGLYVADLDGIEGRGGNTQLARQLHDAVPSMRVWLDEGARPDEAAQRVSEGLVMPVIGSESLRDESDIKALQALPADAYVLSLDFRGETFEGPPELLLNAHVWPNSVIAMTLARVGSGEGPDIARLVAIVTLAGDRRVYAAGGVRDRSDIDTAHRAGASGVLLATALHRESIKADDLREIAGL